MVPIIMKKIYSNYSVDDLQNALQYRKRNNSIEEFIQQVEKNVEKVMRHKLTSMKLTTFLLKYCLDDKKMKEEVARFEYTESLLKLKLAKEKNEENEDQRGQTTVRYIKEILKSVEEINRKADISILNKPSYAQVTKQKYYAYPYNQRNVRSDNDWKKEFRSRTKTNIEVHKHHIHYMQI